jgi:hypothetical protein
LTNAAGLSDKTIMLRSLGLSLMCLAMFSIAGGHWAVLQTVAWAQMLRDYSKDATVAEAVEKTFSGEAPCSMCKQIASARQEEKKAPATVKAEKKAEIFHLASGNFLTKRIGRNFSYPMPLASAFAVRTDAPPAPVPIVRA